MKISKIILLVFSLSLLIACGKQSNDEGENITKDEFITEVYKIQSKESEVDLNHSKFTRIRILGEIQYFNKKANLYRGTSLYGERGDCFYTEEALQKQHKFFTTADFLKYFDLELDGRPFYGFEIRENYLYISNQSVKGKMVLKLKKAYQSKGKLERHNRNQDKKCSKKFSRDRFNKSLKLGIFKNYSSLKSLRFSLTVDKIPY